MYLTSRAAHSRPSASAVDLGWGDWPQDHPAGEEESAGHDGRVAFFAVFRFPAFRSAGTVSFGIHEVISSAFSTSAVPGTVRS